MLTPSPAWPLRAFDELVEGRVSFGELIATDIR
jgi:hypothetical protein